MSTKTEADYFKQLSEEFNLSEDKIEKIIKFFNKNLTIALKRGHEYQGMHLKIRFVKSAKARQKRIEDQKLGISNLKKNKLCLKKTKK